jgi:hypothetical protein
VSLRTLASVPSSAAPPPAVTPGAPTPAPTARPGAPGHSRDLLAGSARELLAAGAADEPERRYAHAHLAALRAAAAVLAARAQPRPRRSGRVRSAWVLLAEVAPELAEWSAFFAAGAGKRAAAEAGLRGVVTEREADDLVREVEAFLALVARILGITHQPALDAVGAVALRDRPARCDSGSAGGPPPGGSPTAGTSTGRTSTGRTSRGGGSVSRAS